MESYLELNAKKFSKKYINEFDKKTQNFNKKLNVYSEQECINIYKTYKELCIFTDLIRISKVFENNNEEYNKIDKMITNTITKDSFSDIYINFI